MCSLKNECSVNFICRGGKRRKRKKEKEGKWRGRKEEERGGRKEEEEKEEVEKEEVEKEENKSAAADQRLLSRLISSSNALPSGPLRRPHPHADADADPALRQGQHRHAAHNNASTDPPT